MLLSEKEKKTKLRRRKDRGEKEKKKSPKKPMSAQDLDHKSRRKGSGRTRLLFKGAFCSRPKKKKGRNRRTRGGKRANIIAS